MNFYSIFEIEFLLKPTMQDIFPREIKTNVYYDINKKLLF